MKQRDQIKAAFDAEKQKLDTTTRRKVRAFWVGALRRLQAKRHRARGRPLRSNGIYVT